MFVSLVLRPNYLRVILKKESGKNIEMCVNMNFTIQPN